MGTIAKDEADEPTERLTTYLSARDFAGVARLSTRAGRADLRAVAPSFGTRRAMLRARPWGSVRRALYRRFASRRDTRATRRVMSTAAAWDGSGTQEDLMYRDECILVVRRDRFGRPHAVRKKPRTMPRVPPASSAPFR